MKLGYITDTFSNKDKSKTFYVLKVALLDKDGKIVQTSQPVIWLTKEQYDEYNASKK